MLGLKWCWPYGRSSRGLPCFLLFRIDCKELAVKPTNPGLFFFGKVFMTDSISALVIALFRFSMSHDSVSVKCLYPEIFVFLLHFPFYWHETVCSNSWWFFVFLWLYFPFHLCLYWFGSSPCLVTIFINFINTNGLPILLIFCFNCVSSLILIISLC